MKFLIIGDLHGNKPEMYFKDFDAIIAPGDFCSDAPRRYMFQALREKLANQNSNVKWYNLVGKKQATAMIKKSVTDGRAILAFLNTFNVPVYAVPGNWEWTTKDKKFPPLNKDYWPILIKGLKNIIDCHHRLIHAGDYDFIGHGIISGPEYPQTKEDLQSYTKKELTAKKKVFTKDSTLLTSLFKKAKKPVIFLSHNVPYNTPIDQIVNPESPRDGQHFGSVIARNMIEKHQPLVCIGGHMHEHFTSCTLGKTVAINAGFGSFVNVLLTVEGNKITDLQFYQGKADHTH